jgi:hypothetical protein
MGKNIHTLPYLNPSLQLVPDLIIYKSRYVLVHWLSILVYEDG